MAEQALAEVHPNASSGSDGEGDQGRPRPGGAVTGEVRSHHRPEAAAFPGWVLAAVKTRCTAVRAPSQPWIKVLRPRHSPFSPRAFAKQPPQRTRYRPKTRLGFTVSALCHRPAKRQLNASTPTHLPATKRAPPAGSTSHVLLVRLLNNSCVTSAAASSCHSDRATQCGLDSIHPGPTLFGDRPTTTPLRDSGLNPAAALQVLMGPR